LNIIMIPKIERMNNHTFSYALQHVLDTITVANTCFLKCKKKSCKILANEGLSSKIHILGFGRIADDVLTRTVRREKLSPAVPNCPH
jgi:hypothetical protein